MKLTALKKMMKENNYDYSLITNSKKINYFTGYTYHPGERFVGLLVSLDSQYLIVNHLLNVQEVEGYELILYYDYQNPLDFVNNIVLDKSILIDPYIVGEHLMKLLELNPRLNYQRGSLIDTIKAVKNEDELEILREASLINDQVMQEVYDLLRIGISEKEVESFIINRFNEVSSGISFSPIVAFGSNGADPHASPSNRKLKENESIVIDMGCIYKGYCSDMTRTFFMGKCDISDVYNLCLKANEEAIKAINTTRTFAEIDAVARNIISEKGYGDNFNHRLGHGIGRSVHEPFDVSGSNDMMIKSNMCFSIEPGIYVKDKFGIRIEDLVVSFDDHVEVLNKFPKKLMIKDVI